MYIPDSPLVVLLLSYRCFSSSSVLCVCAHACVSLCACVFMLYALNFDKYVFVENV